MATRKNTSKPEPQGPAKRRLPPPNPQPERNEAPETAPIVLNSAHVLELAMRERGLTDKGLAEAIRAELGYSVSDETIRQKRTGRSMLSLVQIEDFARVLDIPLGLFIQPISETKFFFAREVQELENMRRDPEIGGRDQGLRDYRWNHGTPACDPEIRGSAAPQLAEVGS